MGRVMTPVEIGPGDVVTICHTGVLTEVEKATIREAVLWYRETHGGNNPAVVVDATGEADDGQATQAKV
jgi:hypothetical protein